VEILNLGGSEESTSPAPKSRKSLRVLLGIGALATVTGIGSTLAANISLNSATAGAVEFGQGVVTTAACDNDIIVTPISTFVNSSSSFALDSIYFDTIDTTACDGKTFTIKAYNNIDSGSLNLNSGIDLIEVTLLTGVFTGSGVSSDGDGFALDLDSTLDAATVYKITVESKNTPLT
jgi:hypothetical protein